MFHRRLAMLLAVDVGNTNIALGVFDGKNLIQHWKIRSEQGKTSDEYEIVLLNLLSLANLEAKNIRSVIISSVVPPLTPVFQALSQDFLSVNPLVVGPGLKTGMPILYENPQEVGADRVVASVAAFDKYGGPAIIVDFGTATTFDAISKDGEYLGGAIAPGIQIAAEALYLKTAKLPRIEIKKPKSVWNPYGKYAAIYADYESYWGRKDYASATGGAFYAGRLSTLEHLEKIKRQASILIIREVLPAYYAPLGIWQMRETVRGAFGNKPEVFNSIDDALKRISTRLSTPMKKILRKSKLFQKIKKQTKIKKFFNQS